MRQLEADWIGAALGGVDASELSPVLELGSSTRKFREEEKPHIEARLHAPLRARGVRIVTTDLKDGEGIDISGDIYDSDVFGRLTDAAPKTVLACNIFEHVTDRAGFAARCAKLTPPGGRIVVTVPNSYPYHLDPIDTMYRPGPSELAALFPGWEMERGEILADVGYWGDLRERMGAGGAVGQILRNLAKSLVFSGGADATRARLHRLMWLFRPFKIAAVVLRRPAEG